MQSFVPFLVVAATGLLPFALWMTSLRTQIKGGLGFFYNLIDESQYLDISAWFVVTAPWRVLGYNAWSQLFWRLLLVTLAFVFVVLIPALFCFGLIALWFTPLRRKGRFNGLAAVQCLRAWAALDVLVFTFIVAIYLGPPFFRGFAENPSQAFHGICTGLQNSLGVNCFDLEAHPKVGLWIGVLQSVSVLTASILVSRQADLWLNMSGACESRTVTASLLSNSVRRSTFNSGSIFNSTDRRQADDTGVNRDTSMQNNQAAGSAEALASPA
jgi:hypothetical protein